VYTNATTWTALDTTNLRLTFDAPASGKVRVRVWGTAEGSYGRCGILDGATLVGQGRHLQFYNNPPCAVFLEWFITGLSAGSHTFDVAGRSAFGGAYHIGFLAGESESLQVFPGPLDFEVWDAT
jgi:hypothetical protein